MPNARPSTSWPRRAAGRWPTAIRPGAARILRDALLTWRGEPLADAAGSDFAAAAAAAARLIELRSSVLADRIEADLALGEGASLVGELRVLLSADPLAERPRAQLMRALYAAGRQAEAIAVYHEGRELELGRLAEPLDQPGGLDRIRCRVISHECIVNHATVRTRTGICQRDSVPVRGWSATAGERAAG
ncbi:MAG TPA: BTAD domain-containing putative transcriptional regulator [Streptosporangiaceae bacterium]|nr:BTAD domain-containing putative transcriptional regulator [Streptosporangiaceae bacterium]